MVQAGQQQLAAAGKEQELGLTGAGALTKAGAEKQAYEQSILDYPLKTATTVSGLLRGMSIPTTENETKVGPGQQGQYGLSGIATAGSILNLLGAAGTAKAGENISKVVDALGRLFKQDPTTGAWVPDNAAIGDFSDWTEADVMNQYTNNTASDDVNYGWGS